MRIPIVLPVVGVTVDHSGLLKVDVDGHPYAPENALLRSDLPRVLAAITRDRQIPVRVMVTEANGTRFTDIATPPDNAVKADSDEKVAAASSRATHLSQPLGPGISATGFQPGEEVAVAYLLIEGIADEQGTALLRLPPAVLARHKQELVLFGLESGKLTPLHPALEASA